MRFPRVPVLGIRGKIQILIFGVILSVGIASIHHARREIAHTLGDELERRGMAIAEDLAAGTADPLLTGDVIDLRRWINRAISHNKDLRYVLLLGQRGDVLLSTFGRKLPKGLVDANRLPRGTGSQEKLIWTEEGMIRDFAVPILGGQAGVVRVGMSDRSLREAVARHSQTLGLLVALAIAFGLMTAYWLATYITEPLSRLASAVRLVGAGDLGRQVATRSNDEVGRLARAFNATTRALAEKERARRALLEKVITSQEDERKRLARDLHDEVVQLLTSALYTLEAVSRRDSRANPETADSLNLAREAVRKAQAETRRLILDLRPTILDDLGLAPAIRQFAESRLGGGGVRLEIEASNLPAKLDPLVETAVFRIIQEACTNAAKYAGAKAVRIALSVADGCLQGEVADDGAGFDAGRVRDLPALRSAGLGIMGMRERAGLLGGSLSVRSAPGCGTTVAFQIPLGAADEEGQADGQHPAAIG